MKKRTAQELMEAAQRAERRARDLRRQAAQRTRAEEAKLNSEIVSAVKLWADAEGMPYESLPGEFRRWAQEAQQGVQGESSPCLNDKAETPLSIELDLLS